MRISLLKIIIAFFLSFPCGFSFCFAHEENQDFAEVESYLESLNSIKAKFSQRDSANQVRFGQMLIAKPDKIRFEYFDQDREIIILNADVLLMYNRELKEMNYISEDQLPIKLLSKRNFKLGKESKVVHYEADDETIYIEFILNDDKNKRRLGLKFHRSPMYIMSLTSGYDNSRVELTFDSPEFNIPVDSAAFDLHKIKLIK